VLRRQFEVNQSLVLRINPDSFRDAEKSVHRKSVNRYSQFKDDHKMKNTLLTFLLLIPILSFGQFLHFSTAEPSDEPDIHYYKFYNGIQMVEFDYLSAYHRRVNYLEQAQPRALSWEMLLGPPHSNVYLFRNESGEIVKQYGDYDSTKFLSVKESLTKVKPHNSFYAQLGSTLGFSQVTTRYFPYYLIGDQSNSTQRNLGLIDSLGNIVLPQAYNVIWKHNKIFITRKDSINELRDIYLRIRFSSHEHVLQPAQFHRGFGDVKKDNKWGLIDSTGKIIVSCKYDMVINSFNESGLAKVSKNRLIGFIDTTGKEVIKCKYESVGDFKEGLLSTRYREKWGYIDRKGNKIISHKYDIGIAFAEGRARVAIQKSGKYYYGFIDKEGNEVIPLIYSNAKDFENGIAEVMVDGNWIKIDRNGVKQ
jgi:WG containing repeat